MKKILTLVLLVFLFSACSNNTSEEIVQKKTKKEVRESKNPNANEMLYCYHEKGKEEVWLFQDFFARKINNIYETFMDFANSDAYRLDPYLVNNPDYETECKWIYISDDMMHIDEGEFNFDMQLPEYWEEIDFKCVKQDVDLKIFKKPTENICRFDDLVKGL